MTMRAYSPLAISDSLYLAQLEPSDSTALFTLTDTDRVHLGEFLPWVKVVETEADSRAHIEQTLADRAVGSTYTYGIYHHGELVGDISIRNLKNDLPPEIGYWLSSQYSGRGIMTAAVQRLLDFGFTTLHLDVIQLIARIDNAPSNRVAEKTGFSFVKRGDNQFGELSNIWQKRAATHTTKA